MEAQCHCVTIIIIIIVIEEFHNNKFVSVDYIVFCPATCPRNKTANQE